MECHALRESREGTESDQGCIIFSVTSVIFAAEFHAFHACLMSRYQLAAALTF